MRQNPLNRVSTTSLVMVFASALAVPSLAASQTVTGQARAVQSSSALGQTTTLADTGTLASTSDAREAALSIGRVPSIVSAEVLRAATLGSSDRVASEASLANLTLKLGGSSISAGLVMAKVLAVQNAPAQASSSVGELTVNGIPIEVTGLPNQTISIPGGRLVLNEQTASSSGTTVNALHATVFGVADVVIASATAGIR
jgi:hypothetical protein